LEHIPNPIRALEECRRVLKPNGMLCFTIPLLVGRVSRSRAGLELSYHGRAGSIRDDYVVHTEFGADFWTFLMRAGFRSVTINQVEFPSAHAITAKS
jgi:SAM-dependent methyltransferase